MYILYVTCIQYLLVCLNERVCLILYFTISHTHTRSWSCDDEDCSVKPHPLNETLGLTGEAIVVIESSECRATVATASGKLATFYDSLLRGLSAETLLTHTPSHPHTLTPSLLPDCPRSSSSPSLIRSLSHAATEFHELRGDAVAKLSVSNFLTVATTTSDSVLWW